MPTKYKGDQLAVRVTPEQRKDFHAKAASYGGTSHVLREMVRAFLEGRIQIQPPKEGTLYVTNN